MRISDWSSDVCSSDLTPSPRRQVPPDRPAAGAAPDFEILHDPLANNGDDGAYRYRPPLSRHGHQEQRLHLQFREYRSRSEEHTSELQSLMRISYAVFCLKKKKHK